jgi:hypothetical protein
MEEIYIKRRKTKIWVDIKNSFKNNVKNFIQKGIDLGMEYDIPTRYNPNELSPEEFISKLDSEKGELIGVYFQETYFNLFVYHNKEGNFSFNFSGFGDFLKTYADGEYVNELVFDTAHYIEIILYMCQDLLITDIFMDEDPDNAGRLLPSPTRNSLAITIGDTYFLFSPYHFIEKVLNNIKSPETVLFENEDLKLIPIDKVNMFYNQIAYALTINKEVIVYFSYHEYKVELKILPSSDMVLMPLAPFKIKETEDATGIDVGFYTHLLMSLCKGISIREFETYFNREEDAYLSNEEYNTKYNIYG